MSSNKESKTAYLLAGTAVAGVAAGFLFRKLFANTSTVQVQTFESKTSNNEKVIKYSQDDNIYDLHLPTNINSGHTRSKSTSQYESKNCNKGSLFETPVPRLHNDLRNNINDLASQKKCDRTSQKMFFNSDTKFYNISIEDNNECNLPNKVSLNKEEEMEYNTDDVFDCENTKKESLCAAQEDSIPLTNIECGNLSKAINVNINTSGNNKNERNMLKEEKEI